MTDDSNVKALRREPDPLIADVEISRLAKLNLIDYERERETVAKRLSIRLPVLDELVALARLKTAAEPSLPFLPAIEAAPWPEPVNGAQLLDEITAAIRRYVVLEKGAAEATALWVVHTYCFDAFSITPRLAITSAVMRCGKTTLLDVLSCLAHRPISTANATPAAIYSYCVTNFRICSEPRSMGNAIASWRERPPISVALLQSSSERGVQAAMADPLGW
jgi:hypothetical protein